MHARARTEASSMVTHAWVIEILIMMMIMMYLRLTGGVLTGGVVFLFDMGIVIHRDTAGLIRSFMIGTSF